MVNTMTNAILYIDTHRKGNVMLDETQHQPIVCNVWRSPLMHVVADGIEIRCKSCRGAKHRISRAQLEQTWKELNEKSQSGILIEKQAM